MLLANLLAIAWEPEFRGIVVVLIGFFTMCGGVYLLLGTNLGARLGLLVSLAGLMGWMFAMGIIWMIYGIGLKGADPSWTPVQTIIGTENLSTTGIDILSTDILNATERGASECAPYLDGRSMFMAGHPEQKFVAYPISESARKRGTSLINWIAELRRPGDLENDWNRKVDKSIFAEHFANWNFEWLDIPALIEQTDDVYEFPMVDRDPLDQWTYGRVTLLGDAAHPMYPIGSNGASQAILDAAALATALVSHNAPTDALAAYEAIRRPATSRIVLSNRQHGPERVLDMAEQRSPDGFSNIEEVFVPGELEAISAQYKQVAGFTPPSSK